MQINIKEAAASLLARDNILILMHAAPDGDTVGSGHALCYALRALGKRVALSCADPIPAKYAYFTESAGTDAFDPDFIVAVDIADTQLIKQPAYENAVQLCIDHHKSNSDYAEATYVNADASACCEIIFDLLGELGVEITPLIADCLYTGIVTDTGCFKYPSTSVYTHLVAAKLMSFGANSTEINRQMCDVKTKARILAEQAALGSMQFFLEDRLSVVVLTKAMLDETGAAEDELDGLAALPRTVEGVEVGILLKEKEDGVFKASVRTTEYVDASALCRAFGGGGHARAAGCTVEGTAEEIVRQFVEQTEKVI